MASVSHLHNLRSIGRRDHHLPDKLVSIVGTFPAVSASVVGEIHMSEDSGKTGKYSYKARTQPYRGSLDLHRSIDADTVIEEPSFYEGLFPE